MPGPQSFAPCHLCFSLTDDERRLRARAHADHVPYRSAQYFAGFGALDRLDLVLDVAT